MLRRFLIAGLSLALLTCAGPGAFLKKPAVDEVAAYNQEWQAGLARAQEMFDSLQVLAGPQTVATVLEPLNDLAFVLYQGQAWAQLMNNVHPDPEYRAAAEKAEQAFSSMGTEIDLSRPLYKAVVAVDVSEEDEATRYYHQTTVQDFQRAGVDRDSVAMARIKMLQEELVLIGQQFGRNIREDVRSIKLNSVDELAGLPADYVATHQPGDDGKITITTDYPDYLPFNTYAQSDTRRLELYMEFRNRGYPQNIEVLDRMIARRHELANLLGFETWADYITADKMIGSAQAAGEFIDRVTAVAAPAADSDYAALLERLKLIDPASILVGDWQKGYLAELVQREQYSFDSQEARQYFPYEKVREGLFALTGSMFALTYRPVAAQVWHPDVESYEVYSGDQLLGRFHLDMHTREGKFKHAAAFQIMPGVAGRQVPEAALICNFPGGDGTPGLMGHGQVGTFFHEFGHLLHHILGGHNQRWVAQSGIETERDFVEVPSQLLEEWIWDLAALQTFAVNEAGEPIPAELVAKMNAARNFGNGINTQHQMYYAAVSLNFYNRDPQGLNTSELQAELMNRYSPFDYVEGTNMHCSFGHLDDYSAIVYTYMWSLVIVKDMFSRFEAAGLMDNEVARRYRRTILEPGGTKPAAQLVRDFLGRDYSFEAFAHWLSGE